MKAPSRFEQLKQKAVTAYPFWLKLPKGPKPDPDVVVKMLPDVDFLRFPAGTQNIWCFTSDEHRRSFSHFYGGQPTSAMQERS